MARLIKHETPAVRPAEYLEPFGKFDRAFERMFEMWPTFVPLGWPVTTARRWLTESFIPVDEYYQDGSLVIRAEIPGIDPDKDVELTVTGGVLHVKAEKREEETVEEEHYLRKEMHHGLFERTLALPEGVTQTDVTASYKDGILEIVVPKVEIEPTKKIPIAKS